MQDPLTSILKMTRPQLEELVLWRGIVMGMENTAGLVESLEQEIEAFKLKHGDDPIVTDDSQRLVESVMGWIM